uniref:Secreted protein n=1 Tax=Ixodes ricinus TaxID=34613 RepID=A0A6B0TUQ0_IXORI
MCLHFCFVFLLAHGLGCMLFVTHMHSNTAISIAMCALLFFKFFKRASHCLSEGAFSVCDTDARSCRNKAMRRSPKAL